MTEGQGPSTGAAVGAIGVGSNSAVCGGLGLFVLAGVAALSTAALRNRLLDTAREYGIAVMLLAGLALIGLLRRPSSSAGLSNRVGAVA